MNHAQALIRWATRMNPSGAKAPDGAARLRLYMSSEPSAPRVVVEATADPETNAIAVQVMDGARVVARLDWDAGIGWREGYAPGAREWAPYLADVRQNVERERQ